MLAREYMNMREEMWEVLAERVGERWNVVEAKVQFRFGRHFCGSETDNDSAWNMV